MDVMYFRSFIHNYLLNGALKIDEPYSKPAIEPSAPTVVGFKRPKKKKNDRSKESTMLAEQVPGHMGGLPLNALLELIEGNPTNNNNNTLKKQNPSGQKANHEGTVDEAKKEKRRKSKETTAAATGNQAAKEGAVATEAASAQENTEEKPVAQGKRTGKSSVVSGRVSTEEGEEEFLSADEGVASSTSEDAYVPAKVAQTNWGNNQKDKKNSAKSPAAVAGAAASEVLLDDANYRADDEDTSAIAKQIAEEEAKFITVAKTKKKVHEEKRTGSVGKSDRKQRTSNVLAEEQQRRSSLPQHDDRRGDNNMKGRRPTTSLADFMEEKKDTHRMNNNHHKHPLGKTSKKGREEIEVDVNLTNDSSQEMGSIAQASPCGSAERSFSYADAAKKSAEQSREGSPGGSNNNSPQTAHKENPLPKAKISSNSSRPEMTSSTAGVGGGGYSFFYDENQAALSNEQKNNDVSVVADDKCLVLKLNNGKDIRIPKGVTAAAQIGDQPADIRHTTLVESLKLRWKKFQEGAAPRQYQPKVCVK